MGLNKLLGVDWLAYSVEVHGDASFDEHVMCGFPAFVPLGLGVARCNGHDSFDSCLDDWAGAASTNRLALYINCRPFRPSTSCNYGINLCMNYKFEFYSSIDQAFRRVLNPHWKTVVSD